MLSSQDVLTIDADGHVLEPRDLLARTRLRDLLAECIEVNLLPPWLNLPDHD